MKNKMETTIMGYIGVVFPELGSGPAYRSRALEPGVVFSGIVGRVHASGPV